MIAIEDMLNIICTEAFEEGVSTTEATAPRRDKRADSRQLPALQFNLELIQTSDGTLQWVE